MLTKNEYLFALENELMEFDEIPNDLIDDEFYMDMVSLDGTLLKNVPIEKRIRELCEKAVKNKFEAIFYTPEKYRDKNLYLLGIKEDYEKLDSSIIPESILYEIKLELIRQLYDDNKKYKDIDYVSHNYENREKIKKLSKVLKKIKVEKR